MYWVTFSVMCAEKGAGTSHLSLHFRHFFFALIFLRDKMHCSWTVRVLPFTYIISQIAPDRRSVWLVNVITSLLLCWLESFSHYRHGTWSQWDIADMIRVSGIFMIYAAARDYERKKRRASVWEEARSVWGITVILYEHLCQWGRIEGWGGWRNAELVRSWSSWTWVHSETLLACWLPIRSNL